MPTKLLPTLDLAIACEVNLNEAAKMWLQSRSASTENPLLKPEITQQMIDELHAQRRVEWSYGSYLEDRSILLRGSYLDETGGYIHLGVDVNVPPNTPIAAPYDATIVNIFDDGNTPQGWGPRLILKPADETLPYLVLGHLTKLAFTVGDQIKAGQSLAAVAPAPYNGDWFPHLHIQQIARHTVAHHELDNYQSLDGYGHAREITRLKDTYPDPTWLVA